MIDSYKKKSYIKGIFEINGCMRTKYSLKTKQKHVNL